MQHVRIIATGAILTAQAYRELHPAVSFANDFAPLDDAELIPEDEAPPAPLAESVDMLNLQLVLIDDGKLAQVEAIIGGKAGDDGARARAYWSKARTARRDNYLVAQLWPAIGYTEAAFNDAWRRAAALNP